MRFVAPGAPSTEVLDTTRRAARAHSGIRAPSPTYRMSPWRRQDLAPVWILPPSGFGVGGDGSLPSPRGLNPGEGHVLETATSRERPHPRNCQIQENAISRKCNIPDNATSRKLPHHGSPFRRRECHIPATARCGKMPLPGSLPNQSKCRGWSNHGKTHMQEIATLW